MRKIYKISFLVGIVGLIVFTFSFYYVADSSITALNRESANSSLVLAQETIKPSVEKEREFVRAKKALQVREITRIGEVEEVKVQSGELVGVEEVIPTAVNIESFSMNETFDDGNHDFGRVDGEMISAGTMFNTDLSRLKGMAAGQKVKIELLNNVVTGTVSTKKLTKLGSTQMFIKLDDSSASTMSIYYGKELTKGKIYMPGKSYQFEAHGNVGFLMGIYEYKKMKNALFID